MEHIKIRYTYKRKEDGKIYQEIVPIECLEGCGDKPFTLYMKDNPYWDIIGRDLFIGLLDKNGKEIYKNDVIEYPARSKPHSKYAKRGFNICVVKWDNGETIQTTDAKKANPIKLSNPSWFNISPSFVGESIKEDNFNCWDWSVFHDCRIIGDIYQNPELLEVK